MAPTKADNKVVEKAPTDKIPKEGESDMKKKSLEVYKIYIFKASKQVNLDIDISSRATSMKEKLT